MTRYLIDDLGSFAPIFIWCDKCIKYEYTYYLSLIGESRLLQQCQVGCINDDLDLLLKSTVRLGGLTGLRHLIGFLNES